MKLHKHLVLELINALGDTFGESQYHADKVIQYHFKNNKKWGSRDRKFFAESFYEIVRYWRKYMELSGFDWQDQKEFLPEQAVCAFSGWAFDKYGEVTGWPELSTFNVDNYKKNRINLTDLSVLESIPDWLDQMGRDEFKTNWPALIGALNKPANLFLRCNELKTSPEELKRLLVAEGLEIGHISGPTLKVVKRVNVFALDAFRNGLFEVQDFGSQAIAPFLKVEPGMRVLDACAGAGGKTLHLAALMKNKGKILATDIHEWKLKELRKRSSRAGVDIIETKEINSKVIKRWKQTVDRLLLDVPCSGMGVLRRNPDTKWKMSPARIDELISIQADIINRYSQVVKSGGLMVYSTCSIWPQENQMQIEQFLKNHSDWKLLEEQTLLPTEQDQDGFYMARLERL